MPLQATSGAASYDAFGGGVAAVPTYIEDVFSTWLYQGTSANQTITNGIDLSTKGGLVWCKGRPNAGYSHRLFDTARGVNNSLATDLTNSQFTQTNSVTAFNTTGFSLGSDGNGEVNFSGSTYASWTFRKQPKFFDVVTWTGNGASNRLITHALGAIPAVIMIKATSTTGSWYVSIRDNGLNGDTTDFANAGLGLESTSAKDSSFLGTSQAIPWTSTQFTLYATGARTNVNGVTYVAYLFAHNAGGFGLTGTDNVISCGSWTSAGSTPVSVNLGYEPQWILWKRTNSTGGNWYLNDNMRGMPVQNGTGTGCKFLYPNLSDAEYGDYGMDPTSTGFNAIYGASGNTFIYIAIRRGPMKVPTSGTSVFSPVTYTAAASTSYSTGLSYIDLMIEKRRDSAQDGFFYDRLRGNANRLRPASASLEVTDTNSWSNQFANQGTVTTASTLGSEWQGSQVIWNMRRAPSFFDEVCYTGTAGNLTISHNLQKIPELIIFKRRNSTGNWWVWHKDFTTYPTYHLLLNTTGALATGQYLTDVTSSNFSLANAITADVNASGGTYATYLFATCAGVSKVFSYTGNGSSQTINCGFTAGARWVLIKRTDSTGDWYVWDSARGIVSGNDPHLSLNTIDAEVTTDDTIDTDSTGFVVNQVSATNVNVSSATYIGIAIA